MLILLDLLTDIQHQIGKIKQSSFSLDSFHQPVFRLSKFSSRDPSSHPRNVFLRISVKELSLFFTMPHPPLGCLSTRGLEQAMWFANVHGTTGPLLSLNKIHRWQHKKRTIIPCRPKFNCAYRCLRPRQAKRNKQFWLNSLCVSCDRIGQFWVGYPGNSGYVIIATLWYRCC